MGMGYSGCLEVVIEEGKLEEIVPTEWEQLNAFLSDKDESSLDELARAYTTDDTDVDGLTDEEAKEAFGLLENLLKAFTQKTGVELLVGYHDNESSGDRYDEVDGVFFILDWSSVFTLTPQAQALKEKFGEDVFDLKQYVVFG